VKHARKSLLFYNQQAWTKRNNTTTFDVTMGSFDGAEVCELVGLFILNTLEKRFGKDVGLYRALPEIWDKMATHMRTLSQYGDQILL
jgi:hypothetical protein